MPGINRSIKRILSLPVYLALSAGQTVSQIIDQIIQELLPTSDYFSADGATSAWYTSTQFSSFYDSVGNKTYIAQETVFAPSSRRLTKVRYFDHATETWSRSYNVGGESYVQNDDHGVPSIAMNADGRLVISWGNHNGNFRLAVTTNPRDITTWVTQSELVGTYTYPHLVLMNDGSMACLLRKQIAPGAEFSSGAYPLVVRMLTFSGSTATVGAEIKIGDLGNDSRWYQGNAYLRPDGFIHQVATRADYNDNVREHVYYYKIDIANQKLITYDGAVERPWPVGITDLNASFRIFQTPSGQTSNTPGFTFDSNGRVHISTQVGETTDGGGALPSPQTLKYIIGSAGVFAAPVDVGQGTQRYNGSTVIPLAGGKVALLWPKDTESTDLRGGSIMIRELDAAQPASAFGAERILMRHDTTRNALSGPISVKDGNSDIRALWCEVAQSSADTSGTPKRLYAWGDGGLIKNTKPSLVVPPALTGDGFWMDFSDLTRVFEDAAMTDVAERGDVVLKIQDRFGTGNVLTGNSGNAPFLEQIGDQYGLSFTGSSAGTRYLTSASKAWTNGGYMCTAIIRHWMPSTVSQHVISLDAGNGNTRLGLPVNVNGRQIRTQAFNGTTGTLIGTGASDAQYGNDYIVQSFTIGTTLYLYVNGVQVASQAISGGAINTQSILMRIGASAAATPASFFMGFMSGMVFRQGEQSLATRQADYEWALTQLPL